MPVSSPPARAEIFAKIAIDSMLDCMKAFEYQSHNGKFIERKRANGFNLWLQHPECDRKGRIIFDPSVEKGEEGNDYNLWSGFRAESLTVEPDSGYANIFEGLGRGVQVSHFGVFL